MSKPKKEAAGTLLPRKPQPDAISTRYKSLRQKCDRTAVSENANCDSWKAAMADGMSGLI
jgi:hypothetical protein